MIRGKAGGRRCVPHGEAALRGSRYGPAIVAFSFWLCGELESRGSAPDRIGRLWEQSSRRRIDFEPV